MITNENLTTCESMIMNIVWDAGTEKLTLQEITSRVNQRYHKDWKLQTVSTFLARLNRKQYTDMVRNGRTFYHLPAKSRDEYVQMLTKDLLHDWYKDNKTLLKETIDLL